MKQQAPYNYLYHGSINSKGANYFLEQSFKTKFLRFRFRKCKKKKISWIVFFLCCSAFNSVCVGGRLTQKWISLRRNFFLLYSMMILRTGGCFPKTALRSSPTSSPCTFLSCEQVWCCFKEETLMERTFPRPAWRRCRASLHLTLQWPPKTAAAKNEKGCFITRAQGKDIQRLVFKHSCHYIFSS